MSTPLSRTQRHEAGIAFEKYSLGASRPRVVPVEVRAQHKELIGHLDRLEVKSDIQRDLIDHIGRMGEAIQYLPVPPRFRNGALEVLNRSLARIQESSDWDKAVQISSNRDRGRQVVFNLSSGFTEAVISNPGPRASSLSVRSMHPGDEYWRTETVSRLRNGGLVKLVDTPGSSELFDLDDDGNLLKST